MKPYSAMRTVPALLGLMAAAIVLMPGAADAADTRRGKTCEPRTEDMSFFRDEAMTVKLSAKLQFNKAFLRERVAAKVSGGVAILTGYVSSSEQVRLAAKLAAETDGIRCVQNRLQIGVPPESPETSPYK